MKSLMLPIALALLIVPLAQAQQLTDREKKVAAQSPAGEMGIYPCGKG